MDKVSVEGVNRGFARLGDAICAGDEKKMEQALQALSPGQSACIPAESMPLEALGKVSVELMARRQPQKIATIDLDATVVESWKRQGLPTYEGGLGYQPMLALWAEMNLARADQFGDGKAPAIREPLSVVRRAFGALPEGIE